VAGGATAGDPTTATDPSAQETVNVVVPDESA
jgi:hypothetical protein